MLNVIYFRNVFCIKFYSLITDDIKPFQTGSVLQARFVRALLRHRWYSRWSYNIMLLSFLHFNTFTQFCVFFRSLCRFSSFFKFLLDSGGATNSRIVFSHRSTTIDKFKSWWISAKDITGWVERHLRRTSWEIKKCFLQGLALLMFGLKYE